MKVIFDHGTPRPLRNYLTGHAVDTAAEKGWSELSNGDLLEHAEKEGYEVLVEEVAKALACIREGEIKEVPI